MGEETIKFVFEKETKNTMRFTEVPNEGEPAAIGAIYLQKWYVGSAKEIEISVVKK